MDGTPTHPLKILKSVPFVTVNNFQRQKNCKLSCQLSPNRWVTQLKTKVALNNDIFIIAKVLDKPLFCNFNK